MPSPDVRTGDVQVVTVDLDQPAAVVERLERLLPEPERDVPPAIRVARAATRIVLADALAVDPAAVVITRTCVHCGHPAHGRPAVQSGDVSFSLSHSGAFGVVALVAGDVRIGVDVEEVRPRARLDALAARIMNDDEHASWVGITDPDERLRAFLRAWTAKESYLKAIGIGIVTRLRDVPDLVPGWQTRELALGDGRVGALALDREPVGIRYSAWAVPARSSGGTAR